MNQWICFSCFHNFKNVNIWFFATGLSEKLSAVAADSEVVYLSLKQVAPRRRAKPTKETLVSIEPSHHAGPQRFSLHVDRRTKRGTPTLQNGPIHSLSLSVSHSISNSRTCNNSRAKPWWTAVTRPPTSLGGSLTCIMVRSRESWGKTIQTERQNQRNVNWRLLPFFSLSRPDWDSSASAYINFTMH